MPSAPLTRPIDAIKHQAKTVTVGISRSEDELIRLALTEAVLAAGAPRDRLSYRALRALAALNPAVEEVSGYTRYRVEGSDDLRTATIGTSPAQRPMLRRVTMVCTLGSGTGGSSANGAKRSAATAPVSTRSG